MRWTLRDSFWPWRAHPRLRELFTCKKVPSFTCKRSDLPTSSAHCATTRNVTKHNTDRCDHEPRSMEACGGDGTGWELYDFANPRPERNFPKRKRAVKRGVIGGGQMAKNLEEKKEEKKVEGRPTARAASAPAAPNLRRSTRQSAGRRDLGFMVSTEARNLTLETDRDEDDPSSSMSSNSDGDPTKEPRQQSSSAESSAEESSEEEPDVPMDYESPTGMEEGGASDP